ncbi:MAG TPA: hypothetical protein VFX58_06965 [Chitinophagaceae bacterium]|nr:hypothetical protein [Chitinophagaceae bacterium]
MRNLFLYITLLAVCLVQFRGIEAQTDSSGETNKTQFKFGLYYNSYLNYYGRTDSLGSSGFFPLAELWLAKGFYIQAAPVFISNALSRFEYAGTVATAGYRYSREEKFAASVYFVKPFYKDNSQLPQSALKGQLNASYTWMNKLINLTAGGDIKFSDQLDYGLTAGLDHLFRLEPGQGLVLVLDPTLNLYAGTQRFSKTYFKQNNILFLPGTPQQETENINRLALLAYEFSMPIVLGKGKFQLIANPSYIIPQNLVAVANRSDLSERGKQTFYITAGVKISF